MIPKINPYFFASPQPLPPSQTWTTINLPSVSIDLPDSGVSVHQSPVLHPLGHSWVLTPWHVWPAHCAGSQPAHVHPESTEHTQVERPRSQRPRGWVGARLRERGRVPAHLPRVVCGPLLRPASSVSLHSLVPLFFQAPGRLL